jgi:hypothetical protein
MESADDVRGSLRIAVLADLRDHEETCPAGEARVARWLGDAGVVSWPLVVDEDSGLILDGSHRAHVLRHRFGARLAPVQVVRLAGAGVRVGAWCRVVSGVSGAAFDRVRGALGLAAGIRDGLVCHHAGEVYGRAGVDALAAYELAQALERALGTDDEAAAVRLADDEEAERWLAVPETLVVRLPALDKGAVQARAGAGRLPPKSTRFVLPYRVVGLAIPLAELAGACEPAARRLGAQAAGALVCLGAGLTVDRRYPERLWQLAGYRIPPALFADPRDQAAYDAALARAAGLCPSNA